MLSLQEKEKIYETLYVNFFLEFEKQSSFAVKQDPGILRKEISLSKILSKAR